MNNIKLGIAVVYYYNSDDEWILDLHLNEILKNTTNINYTIYAATNRLHKKYKSKLENISNLEIVELPFHKEKGAKEHGYYLDLLVRHAVHEKCTHVCTLDADSWPIQMDWANKLIERMTNQSFEVAAVSRNELGDHWLPHPCGLIMTQDFIDKYNPKMWPNTSEMDFELFIQNTAQRMDTGIGIGFALWKHKKKWLKLFRSNKINDHFLMAGIYDGIFFHLGATSRLKVFNTEFNQTWARKLTKVLSKIPILWQYRERIEFFILRKLPPKIHYINNGISISIREKLIKNPDEYYKILSGYNNEHHEPK